jgi:outer membrane protein TolC
MKILLVFVACMILTCGCRSFNDDKIRREHADSYRQALIEQTDKQLAGKEGLGLDDCIRIALQNNLNIRSSEIQKQVAKLQRKVAFANFIPSLEMNYQYVRWDPQPKIKFGGNAIAMHDQRIREITFEAQVSILNPATWFLYSMHARGEEIAELVTDYTKQMTVLEVTALYFHCLSLQQLESALESRLDAAEVLEDELNAFFEEGLVSEWQVDQVSVMVLAQRLEIDKTRRAIEQVKAGLLAAMGLSPVADISIINQAPLNAPTESLEHLILEALLSNPRLHISDREIAIEQEKVKLAIADFLPVLVGFAGRANTSDSFQKYATYWTTGLAGTLSLFDGFANINEYKAAKERKKDAYVRREQATLALMIEVIRAHLNLETAGQEMELALRNLEASIKHWDEVNQKWDEGMINSSEMLQVTADRDQALMQVVNTRFQYQVSIATLLNVIGRTDIQVEEQENEE